MSSTRVIVSAVCVFLTLALCCGVGVYLWQDWKDEQNKPPFGEKSLPIIEHFTAKYNTYRSLLKMDIAGIPDVAGTVTGILGREGVDNVGAKGCVSGHTVCVDFPGPAMRLTINETIEKSPDMDCVQVSWVMVSGTESARDCYTMDGSHWFGGFEDFRQPWALGADFSKDMAPFVTGDAFKEKGFGNVIHPMFISSAGVGIMVDGATPLYVGINQPDGVQPDTSSSHGKICLQARTGPGTPYSFDQPYLIYDVCKAKDIKTLWSAMSKKYLRPPHQIISPEVIKKPIWTTWAIYKGDITQTKVEDFANKITSNNLSVSQIEIDDNWSSNYGDMKFDTTKFPDAQGMITRLRNKNIPVTVWIHPFANKDSQAFTDMSNINGLSSPATWWRGNGSGILDVRNEKAVIQFSDRLKYLKTHYGVTSFKFDAGESNWLPENSTMLIALKNPSYYTSQYVKIAFFSDTTTKRQEVRVGYNTQGYGMMVRMIDRQSTWTRELGLKTIIPCALAFSIMGYPFILPDMIGGNAYDASDIDKIVLPDKELYIRWLEASVFLPVMQFSIGPWDYKDPEVTRITAKFVKLHETHSDLIIRLANESVQTGAPIIRPLWWTDPTDQTALTLDTEFLLGSDLLVAPVLEKGATSRDIYLPRGQWRDVLRGKVHNGPGWLSGYSVALDELAYFTRQV